MDIFVPTATTYLASIGAAIYAGKHSVRKNIEGYLAKHINGTDPEASTFNKGYHEALTHLRSSLKKRKLVLRVDTTGEV